MKVITYQITLHEPVLVKGLEGDPNSGVSYRFLPGSVLRGALIGQYLRSKRDDAYQFMKDTVARRLFFDAEQTRFLNGYLLCDHKGSKQRALPTPLSWHRFKLAARTERTACSPDNVISGLPDLYDHAIQKEKAEDISPDTGDSWQSEKSEFCLSLPGQALLTRVKRQVSVHTARQRDYGRARRADSAEDEILNGAVYRYEAIARGQTFAAYILCQDGDVAELTQLIQGNLLLGGARTAGYGRVSLKLTSPPSQEAWDKAVNLEDWHEAPVGNAQSDRVIITLLSDVLLRDNEGCPQATVAELSRQLGFDSKARDAFVAYRPTGGFNRKWGLPLVQQTALKMGSVLVFAAPSAAQVSNLRTLEMAGIGERREEGYGRFVINWHTEPQITQIGLDPEASQPISLNGSAAVSLAQVIVNNLQRDQLDQQLREVAKTLAADSKMNSVSKTQLNSLRMKLKTAIHELAHNKNADVEQQRQLLIDYQETLEKRNITRRQFGKARVNSQPFFKWLQDRIEAKSMPVPSAKPYQLGGITPETGSDRIRLEYNLRLADLTLARVAKERRDIPVKKEGQNE